jgi:excisionase family DNA binding protein
MTEPWVSVDDVVAHLKVTKDSVYRWIESRRLPAHKVGRHWRFKLSEVDEWIRCGESSDFSGARLDESSVSAASGVVATSGRKQ